MIIDMHIITKQQVLYSECYPCARVNVYTVSLNMQLMQRENFIRVDTTTHVPA